MRHWLKALIVTCAVATFAGGSGKGMAADPGAIKSEHAEPPIEIYSRVARGALRCWFGAEGSLKKAYVFHADVAPPSGGSGAEIAIYERDSTGQTPRSIRAFRITIAPTGGGSSLQSENFRMAPEVARDMSADLGRWLMGQRNCSVVGIGGWKAEQVPLETSSIAPPPQTKKKKSKPAAQTPAVATDQKATAEPKPASAAPAAVAK